MKKHFAQFVLLASIVIVLTNVAVAQQKRGPSTAEERQKAIQIVDLLESDPFSKDAKTYRAVLLKWIDDVPDITVRFCTNVLGDVKELKGDEGGDLIGQQIFAAAKFVILNPDKANDDEAVNFAGLDGVLRTYQSMKKAKPKLRLKSLDKLQEQKDAGTLGEHVKSAMTNCKR